MKHIIKLNIVVFGLLFSAVSCLDKYPEYAIPEEEAITSVESAEQAVIGIYGLLKSSDLYSGLLTLLPDIQCDLVHAVDGYSNIYGDVWRWDILPTTKEIASVYGTLYKVIGRCNFVLEGIEKIESEANDAGYQELQGYKGEAYFARALAYSELIKLYCKDYEKASAEETPGVVLVDSYSNAGKLKRASLQDSYNFVLQDLEKADEYLTELYNEESRFYNTIYFTPYVVKALYARVYLYMDNAEKAVEYASAVIDSDEFYLSSVNSNIQNSSINDYQYMWATDASTEIIWKVGFTGPNSFGGRLGQVFLAYTNGGGYLPDYVPSNKILDLYSSYDKRYDAFFITLQTSHSHQLQCPLLVKYYGNNSFIGTYNLYHMCMPKVFRLSEQYLIRAEAYAIQGKYSQSAEDLTTLRKARFNNFGSTAMNAENWLDVISEERVRELYMEGFRLNDLKRWKKGFEREAQTASVSPADALKIEASNPLFVWPIPQHELDIAGAEIEPNDSNL